jgi:hypothetical protein
MAIYLVDYENVRESGVHGVNHLKADDQVYVFHHATISKISDASMQLFEKSAADIKLMPFNKTAKNYLDFQLSTFLGSLIEKNEQSVFFIISNDGGFDAAIDFWKEHNESIVVMRLDSIRSVLLLAEAFGKATAIEKMPKTQNATANPSGIIEQVAQAVYLAMQPMSGGVTRNQRNASSLVARRN